MGKKRATILKKKKGIIISFSKEGKYVTKKKVNNVKVLKNNIGI